ncbi:PAS domain-containing protein [Nisaea nitritireducens]|uniref:PAS domain-containing protein n=1 Tax=Nisaea nitritireducens TaxID=568392 RepID=UPI001866D2FC|nr:PAS domain-containing protein [Nisaea nitritireducens]
MSDNNTIPLEERAEKLIDYWRGKKPGGKLPGRGHIDPTEIPDLLPHIGLIDVIGSGSDFRYRLVGTHLNQVFGEDFTGTNVSETKIGAYGDFLTDLYRSVLSANGPIVSDSIFEFREKNHLKIRRILLPLARDGKEVDMILFMNIFRTRNDSEVIAARYRRGMDALFDQYQLSASTELSRRPL